MKAIILAAGRSKRMLPLTEEMPKCLLPFGNQTILEYQIGMLKKNGINEIIIVNGFEAEKVRQTAGSELRYVYNPDFMTTNSIYSLYLAKNYLDSDFILLNSDMIINPMLLTELLNEKHPNAILVDFEKQLVSGEMNVKVKNKFVLKIGKNIPVDNADGESVQVCKFNRTSAIKLRAELIRLIGNGESDKFPAFAFRPIIEFEQLKAVPTAGRKWFEIDEPQDYSKACDAINSIIN